MRIFITYRRADSSAWAARIYDRLQAEYGSHSVFQDIDTIPMGVDFRTYIAQVVAESTLQLVIIGPQWATISDQTGQPRLNDPGDFVRIEIESALARGIPIIPVLVEGAAFPSADSLPPSLVPLTRINGIVIRHDPDFTRDLIRLISAINSISSSRERSAPIIEPPPAVTIQGELSRSSDSEPPSAERQAELLRACETNSNSDHPPYFNVTLRTRGEVTWILQLHNSQHPTALSYDGHPDLSGINLTGLDLGKLSLLGANLTEAKLESVNLEGADLSDANLSGALLRQANLNHASLAQVLLSNADLKQANLAGADLEAANLSGAQLQLANLSGARLISAKLNEVDLTTTLLEGAILSTAELRKAILGGMDLYGINLGGALLIEADLNGTDMRKATLTDAVLERAQLDGANLSGANLDRANLRGAILEGANFSGASLNSTQIDSVSVLSSIVIDEKTELERISWNGVLVQQHKAPKTRAERIVYYRDLARQSRRLAVALRSQGLMAEASRYRLREQHWERRALLWNGRIGAWLFSALLDIVAGYGEQPIRALRAYIGVVSFFALCYWWVTHFLETKLTRLTWDESIVLSLTSFHGRGFFPGSLPLGDWVARLGAAEAIIGLFIELVFIATFSRRFLGN